MKGRVAVVTASASGIGKAIAVQLAEQGVKVVVSSRSQKNVDAAVEELRLKGYEVHGVVCHVGKKEDRDRLIKSTIDHYGRIDYLVPNAATNLITKGFLQTTQGQIQKMFDINYKSTFLLIQQALPHLKRQEGSSIVVVGSLGAYKTIEESGHYSLTKLALAGMVKIMSPLLQEQGIRINCVSPGLIKTEFSKQFWKEQSLEDRWIRQLDIKRLGRPDEVGKVVKFLLSDEASYICGESIVVAGKPSARL